MKNRIFRILFFVLFMIVAIAIDMWSNFGGKPDLKTFEIVIGIVLFHALAFEAVVSKSRFFGYLLLTCIAIISIFVFLKYRDLLGGILAGILMVLYGGALFYHLKKQFFAEK